MAYVVKDIFYTLQGEGAQAGRAAVFLRFAGCNLWSGREEDRDSALCRFCDTDFIGKPGPDGGRFDSATDLAEKVVFRWPEQASPTVRPFVVCTGGEPLLQVDEELIAAFHDRGAEVALETNGTLAAPEGFDWICVSPKAGAPLVQTRGDELKLAYPQPGAGPGLYESLDFQHFFLQPVDGLERTRNTQLAIGYCLAHPQWRLSVQLHKIVGIL